MFVTGEKSLIFMPPSLLSSPLPPHSHTMSCFPLLYPHPNSPPQSDFTLVALHVSDVTEIVWKIYKLYKKN